MGTAGDGDGMVADDLDLKPLYIGFQEKRELHDHWEDEDGHWVADCTIKMSARFEAGGSLLVIWKREGAHRCEEVVGRSDGYWEL